MPTSLQESYIPVLLAWLFAIANATGVIVTGALLGKRVRNKFKDMPYESGMSPIGTARERFSVKFYMVAMLFIVFDIETVFMTPWAAYYRQLSCAVTLPNGACPTGQLSFFGLSEMLVFMAILVAGFVYVWKKGALQWD